MQDSITTATPVESAELSELKSAAQSLAEAHAFMLAQAVQSSSDMIAISTRTGEFTFVNEALLRLTGYKSEEVIGKHFGVIVSPNNPVSVAEGIAKNGLESGGWSGDCLIRRRDETEFPAVLNVGPIKDQEGRVTGMFGIGRDISDRMEKEKALLASEEQFRQLADNIHEVFFVATPEPPRMAYLSPAYEEIWGRTRQEVYDRPAAWIDSVHPEDRERVGGIFFQSMQGIQTEMSYRIVRPDGSVRWIEARSFPVRDDKGKFIRTVGIAEDTTVRRRNPHKAKSRIGRIERADPGRRQARGTRGYPAILPKRRRSLRDHWKCPARHFAIHGRRALHNQSFA